MKRITIEFREDQPGRDLVLTVHEITRLLQPKGLITVLEDGEEGIKIAVRPRTPKSL